MLSCLASKPSLRVRSGAPAASARPAAAFAAFYAAKGTSEQLAMTVIDHNGTKVWPLSPKDWSTG